MHKLDKQGLSFSKIRSVQKIRQQKMYVYFQESEQSINLKRQSIYELIILTQSFIVNWNNVIKQSNHKQSKKQQGLLKLLKLQNLSLKQNLLQIMELNIKYIMSKIYKQNLQYSLAQRSDFWNNQKFYGQSNTNDNFNKQQKTQQTNMQNIKNFHHNLNHYYLNEMRYLLQKSEVYSLYDKIILIDIFKNLSNLQTLNGSVLKYQQYRLKGLQKKGIIQTSQLIENKRQNKHPLRNTFTRKLSVVTSRGLPQAIQNENQLLLFEQPKIFSNQSLQQINQLDKKYVLNKKYIQKLKYIQIFKSGILKNSKYFELPYKRSSFSKQQSRQKTNIINTYMELNQFQNCHRKRHTF
ncbi:hypothetical protein ABPG72_007858 [Tetrahymena utriculariae]